MDYQGVALVIGALAGLITVVGGFGMQVAIFIRQGKSMAINQQLHDSVNGQTKELKDAIAKAGFDAGEKAGIASERLNPQVSVRKE